MKNQISLFTGTASATEGKKVGRAVPCPPRRARSARPTIRDCLNRTLPPEHDLSEHDLANHESWHYAFHRTKLEVRKRITRLVIVALVVVLGIVIWRFTSHRPEVTIGRLLPPGNVSPQLAIGLGGATLLAPNGSLWVWGYTGTFSRKGTNTEVPIQLGSETDWSQIAMGGWNNTFALKTNGTLWGWGGYEVESHGLPNPMKRYTKSAQPAQIGNSTNWTQIRAGQAYNLALKADGSLWAWGANDYGQAGDGTTNDFQPEITRITPDHDWKAIAIGDDYDVYYSFALKQNGTVWGWGPNIFDAPWNIDVQEHARGAGREPVEKRSGGGSRRRHQRRQGKRESRAPTSKSCARLTTPPPGRPCGFRWPRCRSGSSRPT